MSNLFIMVGIPGSGKSTFIKQYANKLKGTTCIISRDVIRFSMVAENEEYFSKEKEVFKEFINQIQKGMQQADNVFIDATHISRASRYKLLVNIGNKNRTTVNIVWINTPLEKAIQNNELRKGTRSYVPTGTIYQMHSNFQAPELEEGFTSIYEVNNNKITSIIKSMAT